MREERPFAKVFAVFLAAALASLQPLGAAAQVVRAPSLVPAGLAPSAGAAVLSPTISPLSTAAPALAAPSLPSVFAAPLAAPDDLPSLSAPTLPAAARVLDGGASPASLSSPDRSDAAAREAAGRAFDLSAARPADESAAVPASASAAAPLRFPAAPIEPARKAPPRVPAIAPR